MLATLILAQQDSYLNLRYAVSQAIYGTISSPAYSEIVQLLYKASYFSPNLPVPTGDYPYIAYLYANDYLLKFKAKIDSGKSPLTFGFSDSLPEFRTVAASFARNISALLIAQYADDQDAASKSYNDFVRNFATLAASSPREAFSANPDVSVVFGPFPATIINYQLYGTHGIGAAWLRTGMSVGFRESQVNMKYKYEDVVSGVASHSLCDIVGTAPYDESTCTTGLLDMDFRDYIVRDCGINFNAFRVVDSWQRIDDTCTTIIGDVVQMKLISGVTVFNETDIGSTFTVNYHVLVRNDIGFERIGNYELLSFLSYSYNQNYISKRYSTTYREYFGQFYEGPMQQPHNLQLYELSSVTPGGALYDVLMQQKLYLRSSGHFALLNYTNVPFESKVIQDALDYASSIYGLRIRAIVEYSNDTKYMVTTSMLSCTPDTCAGKYYHAAFGFLERTSDTGLDFSDPTLIGSYSFVGLNLTTDQLAQLRTNSTIDLKFCYVENYTLYTSYREYDFVYAYLPKITTSAPVYKYSDLFSTDCVFAYTPREIALQLSMANSSFVIEPSADDLASFSLVGKEDNLGGSNYVQHDVEIVYKRNSNMVYNGIQVVLSISAILLVISTIVLIALN